MRVPVLFIPTDEFNFREKLERDAGFELERSHWLDERGIPNFRQVGRQTFIATWIEE